ncbi:hypothetical protein [Neisseria meningitidis]|nr:hypothetical protein [Neisseria meningitidis]
MLIHYIDSVPLQADGGGGRRKSRFSNVRFGGAPFRRHGGGQCRAV